jgi:hypothetical protein
LQQSVDRGAVMQQPRPVQEKNFQPNKAFTARPAAQFADGP